MGNQLNRENLSKLMNSLTHIYIYSGWCMRENKSAERKIVYNNIETKTTTSFVHIICIYLHYTYILQKQQKKKTSLYQKYESSTIGRSA